MDDPAVRKQSISLPDSWDRESRSGTWRYEATVTVDSPGADVMAVYIPRIGNRFVISINGSEFAHAGRLKGDDSDFAQRPHFFTISPDLLRAGNNALTFTIQGEQARYAGLSQFQFGPDAVLRPVFNQREFVQLWGSFAVLIIALSFALISLSLAITTRERNFGLFAFACALAAIRTCFAVVTSPPFEWHLWLALLDLCFVGYAVCLCFFCLQVLGIRQKWTVIAAGVLGILTLTLMPFFVFERIVAMRQIWLAGLAAFVFAMNALVIVSWLRRPTPITRILGIAGTISTFLGLYDHLIVFYVADGYGAFTLTRYGVLLFLFAMGWVLVARYTARAKQEAVMRLELAHELESSKMELVRQFDKQRDWTQKMAHQQEREKLIQDLHDSMGLQLNGLLAMVERGELEQDALTSEVRTTIEQMRMLIDTSDAYDGDLPVLLGHLKYRLETRLRRHTIQLRWAVDIPDGYVFIDEKRAIALQRLFFELTTNTIKHARASSIDVHASCTASNPPLLVITFEDDGVGFDSESSGTGIGVASIKRRVADLSGRMERHRQAPTGTRYCLSIDLDASWLSAPSPTPSTT